MPTPTVQLEDLLDLREELRSAGFDPGLQRAIAAHNLLLALAAQGRLPADPRDWQTWLAPVFCSTRNEQEEFYRRFPGWVARHLDLAASASQAKDTATKTAVTETLPDNRVRKVWATALVALVVLAGLSWIWLRRQEASRNNPINSPEEQTTVSPKPKPSGLVLADNDPPATPQPSPTPITPPSRFSLKAWQIALILAPFALYALWLLWRWLSRQALLQRLPDNKLPQLHDLKVEGIEGKLFASAQLRRLLLGLRRPRPMAVRELNIPATVRETIRQGGMFTPAYGARRSSPEYLLLIDRAGAHDEQANVADELRLRLTENGVFVESYYFQSDARSCRSATKDEAAVSLRQLAGRYPDHRLLVFSDGAGFFDPFTGRPQRWLEQFTPWEQRVLLTPEAPAQWGARERELARREFVLLPASASGIEELGEWLNYGLIPAPETPAARPFPEVIEERPQRWLERQKPLPDELEELSAQVRDYLGPDGWDWLAACAVYPEVTWELTLYHGYWLFGGDEQWREAWAERVLRLVRLPWFRYGTMPNWWREHLLGSLSRSRENVVRQGIERLLRSALNPDEPVTLEYAEPGKQRLRARVQAWWQRQRLYWGLRTVEPEEPLRDYVFLRFLAGQRPNRLSVSVPTEILRRLLFKDGQPALGLRPLTMFLLTSAASLVLLRGFYLNLYTDMNDPASQPSTYTAAIEKIRYWVELKDQASSRATGNLAAGQSFQIHFKTREDMYLYLLASNERNRLVPYVVDTLVKAETTFIFPTGEGVWIQSTKNKLPLTVLLTRDRIEDFREFAKRASQKSSQEEAIALLKALVGAVSPDYIEDFGGHSVNIISVKGNGEGRSLIFDIVLSQASIVGTMLIPTNETIR